MRPAPGKKNPLCQSTWLGPRGPADTADPTMGLHFVHKCRNVTHLCFDIALPVSQKNIDIATQVCYRSSFPHSTRNSQFLSFISPKFMSVCVCVLRFSFYWYQWSLLLLIFHLTFILCTHPYLSIYKKIEVITNSFTHL